MSVQFNLLPDVKLEFARQQKAKRLVYSLSFLICSVVIAIFVISFVSVDILQKKLLSDANGDIDKYSKQLKGIPDLDKVLTIQNQLNSLPNLHSSKHYTSRLFAYLPQLTPTTLSIGKIDIDNSANSIEIDGTADSVETVNKFADTLKFTSYIIGEDQTIKKTAFSSVLLSKIDRNDQTNTDNHQPVSFTITANFDPALFTGTKPVNLIVPQEITTRSVLNAPDVNNPLFNTQSNSSSSTGAK